MTKQRISFIAAAVGALSGFASIASRADAPTADRPAGLQLQQRQGSAWDETVRRKLDERMMRLRASGPDTRGLRAPATAVSRSWSALAHKLGQEVSFGAWECFARGCKVIVHH